MNLRVVPQLRGIKGRVQELVEYDLSDPYISNQLWGEKDNESKTRKED